MLNKFLRYACWFISPVLFGSAPLWASVPGESAYIFNSLLFLIGGFLVMWMAAGFCMLEVGLVRTKNAADICLKNILLYSVACCMYFLIGYNLMYDGVDAGFIGSFSIWGADDINVLAEGAVIEGGYAASSDFFFQMVFVATTASIVSGTVAERIKLVPFLIFTVVLSGFIYPIQGGWKWGSGWLDTMGFADFAGSTLVHSVGGWAALTGAIILGPRYGRYTADGAIRFMPGSNLPLATLGTFILWFGWFGFNGASQLALGSAADAVAISNVFVNTNMAAAAGAISAAMVTKFRFGKVDLTMTLNGALAGLVSITAGPDTPSIAAAIGIGAVGAALAVLAVPLLDRLKIDDVVGAISVHLVAGIWGTLAVPLTNGDASLGVQIVGILAIGGFVTIASTLVWLMLKVTVGIRLSEEDERKGSDLAELGLEAYPEFGSGGSILP
ncbi:ammonium transporter [Kordiimonas sp. SCSIO 12610]|uniref:ammonium transporter n=1 Tax=Kordiimonas sp. SCSIO 12610 TaxID=2829597 RepID=UPI00210B4329|nr:ammonium transporter [Kordiimonas sp. SCSIO 12610]UTW55361.1 ammonium transporter [Kordiimonas sp. SCSIO 12610]